MATKLPTLVGLKEAAQMLRIAPQNVRKLKGMPKPTQEVSSGPIWLKRDIESLAEERSKR